MENMYTKLCTTIHFRQNNTKEDNSVLGLGFFVITRHVYLLSRAQTSSFIQLHVRHDKVQQYSSQDRGLTSYGLYLERLLSFPEVCWSNFDQMNNRPQWRGREGSFMGLPSLFQQLTMIGFLQNFSPLPLSWVAFLTTYRIKLTSSPFLSSISNDIPNKINFFPFPEYHF